MMIKNLIFLLCLLVFSDSIFAQFSEQIRSGRPGQGIGAFTVGKNVLQLQQGIDLNSIKFQSIEDKRWINNNVIRFGITEHVELSAVVEEQMRFYQVNNDKLISEGISALHAGFRVNFSDQSGIIPSTCFQMRLKFPGVSKAFGNNYLAPDMIFVAHWDINSKNSLNTNFGLTYNGENAHPTGRYVLNYSYSIAKKWSVFIENYGFLTNDDFNTRFDTGFAFLINNNFQLDLFGGYHKNDLTEEYFISTGVSWRLTKRRLKVD